MTCMKPFPCFAVNFLPNFPSTTSEEMVTEVAVFFGQMLRKYSCLIMPGSNIIPDTGRRSFPIVWSFDHLCVCISFISRWLSEPLQQEVRAAEVGEVKLLLLLCLHPISLTALVFAFCGRLQKAQLTACWLHTAVRRTIWRESVKSESQHSWERKNVIHVQPSTQWWSPCVRLLCDIPLKHNMHHASFTHPHSLGSE